MIVPFFVAMQSAKLTIFGLIAVVLSQADNSFTVGAGGMSFTVDKPSTINWTPTASGDVTLTLREGSTEDLASGDIIASTEWAHLAHDIE